MARAAAAAWFCAQRRVEGIGVVAGCEYIGRGGPTVFVHDDAVLDRQSRGSCHFDVGMDADADDCEIDRQYLSGGIDDAFETVGSFEACEPRAEMDVDAMVGMQ